MTGARRAPGGTAKNPHATEEGGPGSAVTGVAIYKAILQRVLDNRPSGTRLRLAGALGKNRSFISQITNPIYPVPIPARHLDLILDICHLSPAERASFLEAYGEAHPGRRLAAGPRQTRTLTLTVPDFGDTRRNRAYDQMVADLAERLGRYGGGER